METSKMEISKFRADVLRETGYTHVVCRRCTVCGEQGTLYVAEAELHAWREGEMAQNVWPDHPELCEQLISGTHPECFVKLCYAAAVDFPTPDADARELGLATDAAERACQGYRCAFTLGGHNLADEDETTVTDWVAKYAAVDCNVDLAVFMVATGVGE